MPATRASPVTPVSAEHPRVSVVIPLYNCLPLSRAMLASLQATWPAGLTHEIILVDDGSTDGTREWLRTLSAPCRVFFNERNQGYARTNNRGVAEARGEILVLLNDDLVLEPGWLEPMLEALSREPRAGIVGNVQRNASSGEIDHTGIAMTVQGKLEHQRTMGSRFERWLRPVRRVAAVTGACLAIPRALWNELGGFDEGFVNGGEDVDLCFRARAAGRETYVALKSVVRHHVSSSPGRKLRDEENSRRLALRWRDELVTESTRMWCRDYLARAFVRPVPREYRLALAAAAHAMGWRKPPGEAIDSLNAALNREFARWDAMLHASPPA